jgi:hypothetical protein
MIYFAYRFIFELVIPVYKTTRQVKKQFDSVRQNTNQDFHQQATRQPHKSPPKNDTKGDYIEFEEI